MTITNPVAPVGHDPWVIQDDGVYYYCYSHRGRIWVSRSQTIQEAVQFEGQQVWRPEPGQAYSRELWAPELHQLGGWWYIYVAADDGRSVGQGLEYDIRESLESRWEHDGVCSQVWTSRIVRGWEKRYAPGQGARLDP